MESRKRPRTDDSEVLHSKKRVISDSRDSPVPLNGVSDTDEPKDGDSLERFRKDAIYRQMKHYSRENERNLTRIAELERKRNTCEAGLAALEACWTQLISTIRSLVKSDDLPRLDLDTKDIYDLAGHVSSDSDPMFVEQLRSKMSATERLVTSFVRLGGKKESLLLQDEAYKHCQIAQTECSSLRSEVSLLHARLRDAETEKDRYHEQLVAAERRLDRLKSSAASVMNPDPHHSPPLGGSPKPDMQGSTQDVPQDVLPSPSSTPRSAGAGSPKANGDASAEIQQPADLDSESSPAIARLLEENAQLEQQVADLTVQLETNLASDKHVKAHAMYISLQQFASALETQVRERDARIALMAGEIATLRKDRVAFEDGILARADSAIQDYKATVIKRDNELARLREQRDQQTHELNERKAKDTFKQSLAEYKTLVESQSECIKTLKSENTRLRAQMAAEVGEEDVLKFLFQSNDMEYTYVKKLQERVIRVEEFEILMNSYHAPRAADALAKVSELTTQVKQYQSIFGDASPTDVQAMAKQLQAKEEELQKLRLQVQQRDQAEASIYTELDTLSTAWERLEKQVKSKIFDLASLEEKSNKLTLEKAKLDTKFYQLTRDKEAIVKEKETVSRLADKQALVIEKLAAQEKNTAQVAQLMEHELVALKELKISQEHKISDLDRQRKWLTQRIDAGRKEAEEMKAPVYEYLRKLGAKRAEVVRLEDSLEKKLKEAERNATKAKTSVSHSSSSSSVREAQLQGEVDKCMSLLKCSTCKMNMRNTVITKCMHSFCKNCVNERISSRQRKCPACNLPFSQGEVQQLYFQ